MAREWRLDELTHKDVRERRYEVAVLPIGATEPHNLHLPHGCDAFHAEAVADRVCEAAWRQGAKVLLLPTMPYGVNSNMLKMPLAINVYQSTLDRIATDVVHSLAAHGIPKLVLFNAHGGNQFKPLLRELHGKTPVQLFLVDWWLVAHDVYDGIFDKPDDHGGQFETSVALALFDDKVRLEDAGDGAFAQTRFEAVNNGWVSITRPWHLLTKTSGVGDPSGASAEKGERYLKVTVERLATFIKELSDAQVDEAFPF